MGHIRKRGNKWCFVVDLGRDDDGKRKQKWYSGFPTKKAAQAELAKVITDINDGLYVEPTKMTVGEYLTQFLKSHKSQVAAQTYEGYASIVNNHLIPSLGHIKLAKLEPAHVAKYYADALSNGRVGDKGGPLSSTTVLQHHHVLTKALKTALRMNLIRRNPADAVTPPRVAQHEVNFYTPEEAAKLLKHFRGQRLYLPVMLAVNTGMRRGEILGLKWEDVDLNAGTVRVARSVQETKDGISTKSPKTASGRRCINVGATTVEELKRAKASQAANKLKLGPDYDDTGWVCADENGSLISPSSMTHGFATHLTKSDLKTVRFHDLRHTHASLLLLNGENPKVVCERLGHSSVQLTLSRYSHVMPTIQEAAADRFEQLLRTASASK